jgi:purine-binding chemotaxis protein CheW
MGEQQSTDNWENLSDSQSLVAFRLGQQIYALPIEPIAQIIEMITITPIPQVSSAVEGVINVRGVVVPVINLRRHFGLPTVPPGLRTPIILVQVGERTVGLIVDEVIDVLNLSADQVARITDVLPEGLGESQVLQGLVHIQSDTVLLLDLEHIFQPHQAQALARAVATLSDATIEEEPEEAEEAMADTPVEPRFEILVEEASEDGGTVTATVPVDELAQEVEA